MSTIRRFLFFPGEVSLIIQVCIFLLSVNVFFPGEVSLYKCAFLTHTYSVADKWDFTSLRPQSHQCDHVNVSQLQE